MQILLLNPNFLLKFRKGLGQGGTLRWTECSEDKQRLHILMVKLYQVVVSNHICPSKFSLFAKAKCLTLKVKARMIYLAYSRSFIP